MKMNYPERNKNEFNKIDSVPESETGTNANS